MSDIVERLRRWKHGAGCGCTRCTGANEIERLRAENAQLVDLVCYHADFEEWYVRKLIEPASTKQDK